MKKVLLVTFSDNADHQDTLFGMYEEMRNRSDWDVYLLCIKTPKVELQKSDHTWLVDCPERPGVTKKTFNLPLLFSIIHRIRKEHFDAIYFESLHTWNLPIMIMSGKAKTYQVIHEVIPHEGDSQAKKFRLKKNGRVEKVPGVGVDLSKFDKEQRKTEKGEEIRLSLRKSWNIDPSAFVFVSVVSENRMGESNE